MKHFLNWKVIAIILVALTLGYADLPDRLQKIPGTPDSVISSKVHLGLDLQGGTQLDYKIDLRKVPKKDQEQILNGVREVINRRVNGLGVSEPNILLSKVGDEDHIIVELAGIKDVEQAKKTVGKTIQLEFKEEKSEAEKNDPKFKENVRKQADAILKRASRTPEQFGVIGQEEEFASPEKVTFEAKDFEAKEDIVDQKLADALFKGAIGSVTSNLIEGRRGFASDSSGKIISLDGFFVAKVIEKKEVEKEETKAKEVEASHILISYQGAARAGSEVTRTKAEAKNFAEELLEKLKKGEITFENAAKENSDEPGAETSAGKLPEPAKAGGSYVAPFTEAALALEKEDDLSKVTETEFGFHIIRADKIQAEGKTVTKVPTVKYEYIFLSTTPDPWKDTALTGKHFKRAEVQFDQLYQPYVAIKFNDEGGKLFEELTDRNTGKPLAIFVGGDLISAPRVNQKISGGEAIITGQFTVKEAQELARDLNTGAIPAPVILSGQLSIGASLGEEALKDSVKAGLIGIALVILFMIFYYRLPGLVASLALFIYSILFVFLLKADLPLPFALGIAVLIFFGIVYRILKSEEAGWEKLVSFIIAIFVLFFLTFLLSEPVVLTLAGVAGVILSIGMAVDANILIFERMKEELKMGRPLSSAIEIGFERAWSSIRDSNFSSLITTAILFYFGTSIIQGFALTLAAGILISMFTAITVTRNILIALVPTRLAQNLTLFVRPTGERKFYDFIGKTKVWFSLSGVIIGVGLISMVAFGLTLGIDFKGGTLLDLTLEKQATAEEIKQIAAEGTIFSAGERQWVIRTKHLDEEAYGALLQNLEKKFGKVTENRFTTIGPAVGKTLKNRAFLALGLALIAIVLYIAFAFRKVPKKVSPWKFGICAIIALMHDAFIPVGIFSLLGVEIDAFFITALLTIIGFSVHDTIVVFDRIREHLKTAPHDMPFKDIANKALRETMARSINTSLTTLLTLLALLFFGSSSIFYFTLALVIGIVVGTYSSIFIATPLLVLWQKKHPHGI